MMTLVDFYRITCALVLVFALGAWLDERQHKEGR